VRNTDTGQTVTMTAEDQIALTGMLSGGAIASIHLRGGTSRATNFHWEVNGTDGDLLITADSGSLNHGRITIRGATGAESLTALVVPPGYDAYPQLAGQPANAVAHAYAQIRRDLIEQTTLTPDFADARRRHRLLDAIARSATTGQRQPI